MKEKGRLRLQTFERILSLLPPGRLLDLASGHGKFAQIGLRLGWKVTAVDGRTRRFPMTLGIEWVQRDVKEFDVNGYDCIAILGLLYHLDNPLDLLQRCAYATTIIDTHVSPMGEVEHQGYRGQWRNEGRGSRSAVSNRKSFLPTHLEIIRMLNTLYGSVLQVLPSRQPERTIFLCIPKGAVAGASPGLANS